jgi:hypothetical protein
MPDAKSHTHAPPTCQTGNHHAACAASCAANAVAKEEVICDLLPVNGGEEAACTHWPPLKEFQKRRPSRGVKKKAKKLKKGKRRR